jgi:hypothetical protein
MQVMRQLMHSALLRSSIPVFGGQTKLCLRKVALSQLSPVTMEGGGGLCGNIHAFPHHLPRPIVLKGLGGIYWHRQLVDDKPDVLQGVCPEYSCMC